jgi:hypothetical protein
MLEFRESTSEPKSRAVAQDRDPWTLIPDRDPVGKGGPSIHFERHIS